MTRMQQELFKTSHVEYPIIAFEDHIVFISGGGIKKNGPKAIGEVVKHVSVEIDDDTYYCCGKFVKLTDGKYHVIDTPKNVLEFESPGRDGRIMIYNNTTYWAKIGAGAKIKPYAVATGDKYIAARFGNPEELNSKGYIKVLDDKLLIYKRDGDLKVETDPKDMEIIIKGFEPVKQSGFSSVDITRSNIIPPPPPRARIQANYVVETKKPIPSGGINKAYITFARSMQALEENYTRERTSIYENLIRALSELDMH